MAKAKTYRLKGRGQVGYQDGDDLVIVKQDRELTESELKNVPKEQQKYFEEAVDEPVKEEEVEQPVRSMQLGAKEAISHISKTSTEELKGFLSDHEDRVTVQEAWDKKFETGDEDDTEEKKSGDKKSGKGTKVNQS